MIIQAFYNLIDNPSLELIGEGIYENIVWRDERTQPTEAEIQAEITRLQAEYDSKQYQRDRAEAYPPLEDQLDDIFHNGLEGWKANIQVVKDAHPKPTGETV